ncbi:MAG: hypothetical protein WA702_03675 [Bradyrhizobium sp.]|jgi:hypothetical protein|uniref:hypothetical protein n=1 Tax=Bradyrhizobium sp. TaxID=376 RepID=UPI003C7CBE9E
MTAIVAPKSPFANWLEGVILTAILQGLPTYAGAALMLRLARQDLVRPEWGAISFVVIATIAHALLTPLLSGPRCRMIFKYGYEPLFFDPLLPLADKVAQWRAQPRVSVQLVTSIIMMSLLAVAALSMR